MTNKNKNRPGYKETKIGWIPEDWEISRIKDITNIKVAGDLKESCYSEVNKDDYIYPIYSNTVENNGLYGYYNFKEFTGYCLTVIGRGAGLGTAFVKNGSFGAIGRLLILFPKNNCDAKFLSEYINGYVNFFVESAAIPQLTGEHIGTYQVILPPLPEQKKIAEILSTWDRAIAIKELLIKELNLRKKAFMQRLLTGKVRFKEFVKSGDYLKTRIGLVPKDWKLLKASEIFDRTSKCKNGITTLLSVTQDQGVIPRDMLKARVTMPSGDTDSFKIVEKGNFVISLRTFQGGIEYSEYDGLVSPAYTVLTNKIEINEDYYRYFFKSRDFIFRLSIAVIGIRDGKQISYNDFGALSLYYPTIEEQRKIASVLTAQDKQIDLLKQQKSALEQQKKGLMQKLLTGDVRVL